jgi:CRISPR-associated endonuclease/helicase Cas3
MSLAPTQFSDFFLALWQQAPFPWQQRLAQQVCADGWPDALDLPTASGKTAAIDIALFHLALQAERGAARMAPLRILLVVDRRLVVDSAFERAERIARRLASADGGVLRTVADALRRIGGDDRPVHVARLRGGVPREPDWARSPAQPTVVISTVDQVGSRLLFRGYGVSDSMRPVHAGLLSSDVLLLLDEAHLSQPFAETLDWVQRYRRQPWAEVEPGPFTVVRLSATLPDDAEAGAGSGGAPFRLATDDRGHAALGARLEAHKRAALQLAKASLSDPAKLASKFAEAAAALGEKMPDAQVIAVVVNRVGLARAVHEALLARCKTPEGAGADVELLIGRARPLDSRRLVETLLPRMRAQDRQDGARRLFVVATQCVEAGADLDFDGLVTQIAPLDCLRQRFGRLDRLGRHGESRAVILAASDDIGYRASDPIYGEASRATWEWLKQIGGKAAVIDFGIDHLPLPPADQLAALLAPRASAPVLLPAYVDALAQTSPRPGADPEVALFLHGPAAGPAEVQIVWRADLAPDDLADQERCIEIVASCPPSALEAVSVPLGAARRWLERLAGKQAVEQEDLTDVEGTPDVDPLRDKLSTQAMALRWLGPEHADTRPIGPRDLRPGELIVVPASHGGCDRYGWAPADVAEVADLGFEAMLRQRHRLILRLAAPLLQQALVAEGRAAEAQRLWRRIATMLDGRRDDKAAMLAELAALDGLPGPWQRALQAVEDRQVVVDWPYGDAAAGAVLSLRPRLDAGQVDQVLGDGAVAHAAEDEAATEADAGSFASRPVGLDEHCRAVEEMAAAFARGAGLPPERVADIALAARLHDAGKAEARFQIWLHGGDEVAWLRSAAPLAKSGAKAAPAAARRAGLPPGMRHECWSVRLAETHPALAHAADPDLVLWLIGSHHGHGRPLFPPVADPDASGMVNAHVDGHRLEAAVDHGLARLDSGWIERFGRLQRRYGPWELARMEAILRLADHRVSGEAADWPEASS